MGDRLKGKSSVVTGAGRGIGREIALALAAEGANVVVVDPGVSLTGTGGQAGPADDVVAEIKKKGGNAVACYESVADLLTAEKIIKCAVDNFGGIHVLVNVAGIIRDRMAHNMTFEEWDQVIKVHLYGTFNTCRHAIPLMRQQKYGRIINTTSDAWKGTVGHCNYGAAKGGIVSLTYALARELGKFGVTANCIAPAAGTRMTLSEDTLAGFKKRYEAGLMPKDQYEEMMDPPGPEFIAPIVTYLASDYGANVNGSVFGCGGGKITLHSVPEEVKGIFKDREKGPWTMDELIRAMPKSLLAGYANVAPAEGKKE